MRHIPAKGLAVWSGLLTLVFVAGAKDVSGQSCPPPGQNCWSADSIVRHFAWETAQPSSDGVGRGLALMTLQGVAVPPARRDSVADGLARVALESPSSESRQAAASYLVLASSRTSERPLSGGPARLVRIYRQTTDPLVRMAILWRADNLAEPGPMLMLMREVATQPGDQPWPEIDHDPPARAAWNLAHYGEEGRAVLRQLHASGAVRSPRARLELEQLARNGFRLPGQQCTRQRAGESCRQ
jgi:hypothetical protein